MVVCRTRSADTRSVLRVRLWKPPWRTARLLRNSCARALGILSIVIVVVVIENEVRFFWCFFFSIFVSSNVGSSSKGVPSRCSRVAIAASVGASSNVQERWRQALVLVLVFFHLCAGVQNPVRHETLHGAEAQVQHRLLMPSTSSPRSPCRWTCDGTEANTAPHREGEVHIHSGCCPDGAAQCKQSQACDRLLLQVALALPALRG